MQNNIAHQWSPSEASWGVTIQDVTVKPDKRKKMLQTPLAAAKKMGEVAKKMFSASLVKQAKKKYRCYYPHR